MAYNFGTAAEVLENVFEVIEGGKAVEAAGTAELIADNGAKIFDIATKEVYAANGSATTVAEVVSIGEGATAGTTAGAGILAMDVGAVGAAIAPALGILAGIGLYNLAPEFWDNVAMQLVDAGQTVKGKVVGLLTEDGKTAFSKEVIDIYKDAFLNANLFNPAYSELVNPQIDPGLIVRTPVYSLGFETGYDESLQIPYICANAFSIQSVPGVGNKLFLQIAPVTVDPETTRMAAYIGQYDWLVWVVASKNINIFANQGPSSVYARVERDNGSWTATGGYLYSFSVGQTTYYYSTIGDMVEGIPGSPGTSATQTTVQNLVRALFEGDFINDAPLQEDAVYPQPNVEITTTYPEWDPIEFPQSLPVELPDYFPVSIPTPDITQDPSQSGDNDLDTQLDTIIEILFNALPQPDPGIEPDPDASEEPETTPQPEPQPDPNPSDPNPPVPTPSATIPIPTLDTTRADRMYTVYNPTDANINSLGAFLWTSSIIEQIKKLWDDPMQAIISFHKIYGAPSVGASKEIVLGYIDSGVSAPVVTSQFCEIDCGSVTVPELLSNATSYSPFTSLHIYLPFIGIMELDTNECMNASLNVKYRIDVYTGTCIALIYATRNPDLTNPQILYTFSGNASQQLPLTSSSFGGAVSALLGLAGAGVAVASGGALGVAAGALGAAHSLTQEMVHINRSGGLSANAGILGPRTPYLILARQYGYDANGYAGFYGYPANKTVYIGNCNGFIKCKDVIFRGSCTQAEVEEITTLLKSGVYV